MCRVVDQLAAYEPVSDSRHYTMKFIDGSQVATSYTFYCSASKATRFGYCLYSWSFAGRSGPFGRTKDIKPSAFTRYAANF